jgi:hypothetical protein
MQHITENQISQVTVFLSDIHPATKRHLSFVNLRTIFNTEAGLRVSWFPSVSLTVKVNVSLYTIIIEAQMVKVLQDARFVVRFSVGSLNFSMT